MTVRAVPPQEQPHSNHSRSSHPPTAFRATGLACFGGILAARPAKTATLNPAESRRTDAPDAWFDHAAGGVILRKPRHCHRTTYFDVLLGSQNDHFNDPSTSVR